MSYLKDLKDSKTFIIYAVIAAIVGVILTFFVGGCGKSSDKAKVLVSKRVRVEVREGPSASHYDEERVVEEAIKPGGLSAHKKTTYREKTSTVKKAPVKKALLKKASVKKATAAPGASKKRTVASKKSAEKLPSKLTPWAVNVVSFLSPAEAEGLRTKLNSSGYNAYVTKFRKGSLLFYRVRVGFFKSRDEALKNGLSIVKEYRNVGKPWVVKPAWREVTEHIR